MKTLFRKQAILLAALLQIMPFVRDFVASPAVTSTFAIICRIGVGAGAMLGAYDAFSAASDPYFVGVQTNVNLMVGVFYSNNIVVTNTGTDHGAYFELTTTTLDSGQIGGNGTSTVTLPGGMTLKCYDTAQKRGVYAAVYGTPTTVTASYKVKLIAGYSGAGEINTNLFFAVNASGSPPIITNNPTDVTVIVGNNATFSVTNGGTGPFTYQWYYNTNTAVANATNASLTLTNAQLSNAGYYRAAITNAFGSTNSASAKLTVWEPPVITNQPAGFTNVAGGSASFTVLAGGTPAVSYQWKFNGATVIPNATNSTYSITNARAAQAGPYIVVITNAAGAVTSSPAYFAVTNPPSPGIAASSVTSGNGLFQFTFAPVVGLTNTVLTNSSPSGGVWAALTNVPPPVNANPVTVKDALSPTQRFYRIQVVP